jgi:TctA family transporter
LNARIRSPRDFFAGAIFLSFGLCAVFVGRDYPMGTALRMGVGYFPCVLGLLLFVGLALFFGLLASLFINRDCEPAPLLLGFVLGPMVEDNLRRAILPSSGNPAVFFTRPLSLALLLVALALLIVVVLPAVKMKREEALQE